MANAKLQQELISMLNDALKLEHAARIQYLAHAELIKGITAEKVIERIKEIADDELKHEGMFRELIGNYLGGVPTMNLAETHEAKNIDEILKINLQAEKDAIDFYKKIYDKICDNKKEFPYSFEALEHTVRHIILDEQEHIVELSILLGL